MTTATMLELEPWLRQTTASIPTFHQHHTLETLLRMTQTTFLRKTKWLVPISLCIKLASPLPPSQSSPSSLPSFLSVSVSVYVCSVTYVCIVYIMCVCLFLLREHWLDGCLVVVDGWSCVHALALTAMAILHFTWISAHYDGTFRVHYDKHNLYLYTSIFVRCMYVTPNPPPPWKKRRIHTNLSVEHVVDNPS